jgi:hypothetical protein
MKLFAVVDHLLVGVLRIARTLLGLALFGGAVLLAIGVALGVLVWALLRGRRPMAVRSVWRHAAARQPFGAGAGRASRSSAEVVDVEAREVPGDVASLRPGNGG